MVLPLQPTLTTAETEPPPASPPPQMPIPPIPSVPAPIARTLFVLMGQSNMVGYGFGPSPIESDGRIEAYDNHWHKATEPLFQALEPEQSGHGPGLPFAVEYLKTHPTEHVGLILCAEGGSWLEDWVPGHRLYNRCAEMIQKAKGTDTIKGYLWLQGESDAQSATTYPQFKKHVDDYAETLEFIKGSLPSAPWTIAVIGTHASCCGTRFDNWELIQDQLRTFPNHFETADLNPAGELHFSTNGYIQIGRRFAHQIQ